MRTTPPLIVGLVLVSGMLFLNMREPSVADTNASASKIGMQTASVLSVPTTVLSERKIERHAHKDPVAPEAPRRRVITKAAAGPAVSPQSKSPSFLAVLDKPDIQTHHKQIANNVLLSLPEKCRDTLKNFYVRYQKQEHRGLAGKSVMILDGTVPDAEFRALFVHESGHNWDLGCFHGTADSGKSPYSDGDEPVYTDDPSVSFYQISWITSHVQRSNARPEDFVSGYASYDVFEDFAESFAYFVLQNDAFRTRAQQNEALAKKYNWILVNIFDGQIPEVATGKVQWKGKVPWDITKLKYVWNAEQVVASQ